MAMLKARTKDQWNHTASIRLTIAQCHAEPSKAKRLRITDFHPAYGSSGGNVSAMSREEFHQRLRRFLPDASQN